MIIYRMIFNFESSFLYNYMAYLFRYFFTDKLDQH